ncbi:hypothetical protein ACFOYU_13580 [Microvirga sp. GCM10011540]|uniref:hypothetical protein n=1 Tax=Microvirga sp. GCM10011540 TaxID=3317338 RepID=UPI00361725C8
MSTILVRVLASRWVTFIGFAVMAALFWDSGFGRLAAFNIEVETGGADSLGQEVLFGFVVIIVQMGGLALIMTDRWNWLGAVAFAGLALLSIPGSQPWASHEAIAGDLWAVARHLAIFMVLIMMIVLSPAIRKESRIHELAQPMPELSWRQMVLVEEGGSLFRNRLAQGSQKFFDRFYDNLHSNALKG